MSDIDNTLGAIEKLAANFTEASHTGREPERARELAAQLKATVDGLLVQARGGALAYQAGVVHSKVRVLIDLAESTNRGKFKTVIGALFNLRDAITVTRGEEPVS